MITLVTSCIISYCLRIVNLCSFVHKISFFCLFPLRLKVIVMRIIQVILVEMLDKKLSRIIFTDIESAEIVIVNDQLQIIGLGIAAAYCLISRQWPAAVRAAPKARNGFRNGHRAGACPQWGLRRRRKRQAMLGESPSRVQGRALPAGGRGGGAEPLPLRNDQGDMNATE